MSKICSKCNQSKPLSEFYPKPTGRDGMTARCKCCTLESNKISYAKHSYRNAKYREDNKEKRREHNRRYRLKNKAKWVAKEGKRRALKKSNTPEITKFEQDMIEALYFIAKTLSKSCGEQFHVDHIKPISKGGTHEFSNLQILSAEENYKKSNKYKGE